MIRRRLCPDDVRFTIERHRVNGVALSFCQVVRAEQVAQRGGQLDFALVGSPLEELIDRDCVGPPETAARRFAVDPDPVGVRAARFEAQEPYVLRLVRRQLKLKKKKKNKREEKQTETTQETTTEPEKETISYTITEDQHTQTKEQHIVLLKVGFLALYMLLFPGDRFSDYVLLD